MFFGVTHCLDYNKRFTYTKIKMIVKILSLCIITVKSYKTLMFKIQFVCLNLVFLARFQKLQESYEFVCSLLLETKFSSKTRGLSFPSSVLQVFRIFGVILMFFPSQSYFTSCFADAYLFTNAYPIVYDTCWMQIPTF